MNERRFSRGMPYKSDAQRRKFHAMEDRGEISHAAVKEWDRESKGMKLPEYADKGQKAAKAFKKKKKKRRK